MKGRVKDGDYVDDDEYVSDMVMMVKMRMTCLFIL
jgi:hypothetical protein